MRVGLLAPAPDTEGADSTTRAWDEPDSGSSPQAALLEDLYLGPILDTMSGGDARRRSVAQHLLLAGSHADPLVAGHRQAVLADAQAHPAQLRALHDLAGKAVQSHRHSGGGLLNDWPTAILTDSVTKLDALIGQLAQARDLLTDTDFTSSALRELATTMATELDNEYLAAMRSHLDNLRPGVPVTVSAQLGWANEGTNYTLSRPDPGAGGWLRRLGRSDPGVVRVDDRDDRSARALSELRDAAVAPVAGLMTRVLAAITRFFTDLRDEVGFYVSCLDLADALAARGIPTCTPVQLPDPGVGRCTELVDIGLALAAGIPVVGNSIDASQDVAVIVTGANQGGKSTFLRSWGQATLMAQAGMFVAAEEFRAPAVHGFYTHFTRVEDASMRSGRLDEELSRLSEIVSQLHPEAMVALNESLSSTNEREGSSLAAQIVAGLTAVGVRVIYVTHLYEFARVAASQPGYLLLRAPRNPDGSRSYRLEPGAANPTSYGLDLYERIMMTEGP